MNNSNIAGIMAILALCVGHRATVVASTTDFNVCYSGSNGSDGRCSSRIGETHRCSDDSVLAPAKKEKVTKCIRGSDTPHDIAAAAAVSTTATVNATATILPSQTGNRLSNNYTDIQHQQLQR